MDDRLDSYAEAWRPAAGDKLVGEVIELGENTTEHGTYPVVTIATDGGDEFAFHGFHTVAKNELSKQRPEVGDRIGIKYRGQADGKSYQGYKIVVERAEGRPAASPSWDKMATEAKAETAAMDEEPF